MTSGREELSGGAQGVPGFTMDKTPWNCLRAGLDFAGIGLGVLVLDSDLPSWLRGSVVGCAQLRAAHKGITWKGKMPNEGRGKEGILAHLYTALPSVDRIYSCVYSLGLITPDCWCVPILCCSSPS